MNSRFNYGGGSPGFFRQENSIYYYAAFPNEMNIYGFHAFINMSGDYGVRIKLNEEARKAEAEEKFIKVKQTFRECLSEISLPTEGVYEFLFSSNEEGYGKLGKFLVLIDEFNRLTSNILLAITRLFHIDLPPTRNMGRENIAFYKQILMSENLRRLIIDICSERNFHSVTVSESTSKNLIISPAYRPKRMH